jgi:hypothetical protein
MGWLQLANLLLGLAKTLLDYVDRRQLIDAGMAKAALEGIQKTNEVIDDALQAARAVRDDPNSDYARRLRAKYSCQPDRTEPEQLVRSD